MQRSVQYWVGESPVGRLKQMNSIFKLIISINIAAVLSVRNGVIFKTTDLHCNCFRPTEDKLWTNRP